MSKIFFKTEKVDLESIVKQHSLSQVRLGRFASLSPVQLDLQRAKLLCEENKQLP